MKTCQTSDSVENVYVNNSGFKSSEKNISILVVICTNREYSHPPFTLCKSVFEYEIREQ